MEKHPEKGKHTQQMGKMQMILHLYQPILLHHKTTKQITQDIQTKTCMQSHMSYKPLLKISHKVATHHALCTTTIALKESCDGKPTLMRRYNTHIFWHAPMTKLWTLVYSNVNDLMKSSVCVNIRGIQKLTETDAIPTHTSKTNLLTKISRYEFLRSTHEPTISYDYTSHI